MTISSVSQNTHFGVIASRPPTADAGSPGSPGSTSASRLQPRARAEIFGRLERLAELPADLVLANLPTALTAALDAAARVGVPEAQVRRHAQTVATAAAQRARALGAGPSGVALRHARGLQAFAREVVSVPDAAHLARQRLAVARLLGPATGWPAAMPAPVAPGTAAPEVEHARRVTARTLCFDPPAPR